MEVNEQLIQAITRAVVEQLRQNGMQPSSGSGAGSTGNSGTGTLAGKTRMREMGAVH